MIRVTRLPRGSFVCTFCGQRQSSAFWIQEVVNETDAKGVSVFMSCKRCLTQLRTTIGRALKEEKQHGGSGQS